MSHMTKTKRSSRVWALLLALLLVFQCVPMMPVEAVGTEETETALPDSIFTEAWNQEYDVLYHEAGKHYTYGGKEVTFPDGKTVKVGETTYPIKNAETAVTTKTENGKTTVSFTNLKDPVGTIPQKWNSTFNGRFALCYEMNGKALVSAESSSLVTSITVDTPKDGTYTLTGGKIFEACNEWSDGYDFGQGKVKERKFGYLPDVTIQVGQQKPAEKPAPRISAKIGDTQLTVTEVENDQGYVARCSIKHTYVISVPETLKNENITISGLEGYNYRPVKSATSCWGGFTNQWTGTAAVNEFGYHLHDLHDKFAPQYKDLHIIFKVETPAPVEPEIEAPFTAKIGDQVLKIVDGGEVDCIEFGKPVKKQSYCVMLPAGNQAKQFTYNGMGGNLAVNNCKEMSIFLRKNTDKLLDIPQNGGYYHFKNGSTIFHITFKEEVPLVPEEPEQPAVEAPFTAKIGDQVLKIVDGGKVDCIESGKPVKKQNYCVVLPAGNQAKQFTYNGMGGQLAENSCEEISGWLYEDTDKQLNILSNGGYYHVENGSEGFHITFKEGVERGKVSLSVEARTAGKGDLIPMTTLPIMNKNCTVKDVLDTLAQQNHLTVKYSDQGAIVSIGKLANNAEGGGWRCFLNGKAVSQSVQTQTVNADDVIRIRYAVTAAGSELDAPLFAFLKERTKLAKEKLLEDYTQSSKRALEAAVAEADAILADSQNNSAETDKELLVSDVIGKLNRAEAKLTKDDASVGNSAIPDDFENDLWLQYDFKEMKIGDTAKIYPRRVPQIIDSAIENNVTRPNFNFEVVQGESVKLSGYESTESVSVTAVKDGITIVKVTYDACDGYGASSPINAAYVVFHVNSDPADLTINTSLSAIRSYDTIYYAEGDTVAHTFTVDVPGAKSVKVTCNDKVLTANADGTYTANLENRSNVLGIEAVDASGKVKSYYHVVDARKIQITIQNMTSPGQPFKINDRAKVSFKGITMPVYKLATIYNPCFGSDAAQWGNEATYVHYQNEQLGEFKGQCSQYDLATKNSFEIRFTEAGDYTFTGGNIHCYWWGDKLGADKEIIRHDGPNMGASVEQGNFSVLPDFTIKVASEVSEHVSVAGITLNKTELTLKEGESFQLSAKVLPEDADNQNFTWKLSNGTGYFITIDENGLVTAHHANHEHVPFVTVTVTTEEGDFTASCKVTVVKANAGTDGTDPDTSKPDSAVLSGGSLTVAAPVAGKTPQKAATKDQGYEIVSTTWNPEHKTFKAGTAYRVEIVLEAKSGEFSKDAVFTVNGKTAQVKENTGSRVTISLDFQKTADVVTPQTGDSGMPTLLFTVSAVSMLAVAALLCMQQAQKKRNTTSR